MRAGTMAAKYVTSQSYKPQAVCAYEKIFNDVTMMSFYCHSQWALVAIRSGELGTYMYPT